MKVILIPVADRPECAVALDQAFSLADACGGSIVGCHLRPHRSEQELVENPATFFGFKRWMSAAEGISADEVELKSKKAAALFEQKAAERGFTRIKQPKLGVTHAAQWIEMVGSLDKLFSIVGPTSDVAVVSRPKRVAKGPGIDFMLAALLGTGKPVIVLPQTPLKTLGKRVLIAWNQSVQAARAVSASLPLLLNAESVHIVSAGPESRAGPKAQALVNYLKFWGVKASRSRTRGRDAAADVLDVFRKEASDLIVMGAYSRGRFRETIFGGVTEDLLFRSPQPVFALHS